MIITMVGSGAVSQAITKPDLTSWDFYWKLDEGSGLTVTSYGAKTGLNGSLTNLSGGYPLWETDPDLGGSCLNFGNSTSFNLVTSEAYPSNFRPTTALSVVVALKVRSLGGVGLYPPVIGMYDYITSGDQNGWNCDLSYNNGGSFRLWTTNGGSSASTHTVSHATAGISADTAFLFGWVKDGTSSKLFINGVQVGTTGSAQSSIGYIGNEKIVIGQTSDPSGHASSVYSTEGKVGFAAGIVSAVSDATMLSIAQEAGFA